MSKFSLSEALAMLEDGAWHSVAYVSADSTKKAGGHIVRIPSCRINRHTNLPAQHSSQSEKIGKTKTQRHSLHATRNLTLKNGQSRKMHIYTLFAVDQNPVI